MDSSCAFLSDYMFFFAVGCADGEITLWEVGLRERIVSKPFKIWNLSSCSVLLQVLILPLDKKC